MPEGFNGNGSIFRFAASGQGSLLAISGLDVPLSHPQGLAMDGDGALYMADHDNNRIIKAIPGAMADTFVGKVFAVDASLTRQPSGLAMDRFGTL
jgi:sugar lactone lactonase YvrE